MHAVTAASVIGPGHVAVGGVRQDDFSIAASGGVAVAVAADGLGSAAYSHVAAAFACRCTRRMLSRTLAESSSKAVDWIWLAAELRSTLAAVAMLLERAEELDPELGLATTLLGAVVAEEAALIFNLGDGAVAGLAHSGEQIETLAFLGPEHGPYVGDVFPLTSANVDTHLRMQVVERADRILIATDGVAEFALSDDEQELKDEFVQALDSALSVSRGLEAATGLQRYLSGKRASAVNRDDKTLIWIAAR